MSSEYSKCDHSYKYSEGEDILHIIYKKDIPKYITDVADIYEGKIDNRIGINFPMNVVEKVKDKKNKLKEYLGKAKYVVVYKKGDKMTKDHELLHAKYHLDREYRDKIRQMWDKMRSESKKKVITMLHKMGYPRDNEDILIDEFQAYYYTEKENFFGKNLI